jgi:hypothetical protein
MIFAGHKESALPDRRDSMAGATKTIFEGCSFAMKTSMLSLVAVVEKLNRF